MVGVRSARSARGLARDPPSRTGCSAVSAAATRGPFGHITGRAERTREVRPDAPGADPSPTWRRARKTACATGLRSLRGYEGRVVLRLSRTCRDPGESRDVSPALDRRESERPHSDQRDQRFLGPRTAAVFGAPHHGPMSPSSTQPVPRFGRQLCPGLSFGKSARLFMTRRPCRGATKGRCAAHRQRAAWIALAIWSAARRAGISSTRDSVWGGR